jgi:hypothetical protein
VEEDVTHHYERIAVFGDLSGHVQPLLRELVALGIRFDNESLPRRVLGWPQDLACVQVGDLVHKGPHSEWALGIVHDLLLPTGRWVQLLGNHEAQYLPGGHRFWPARLDARAAELVAALWDERRIHAAAAVVDGSGAQTLITHAGLSPVRWRELRTAGVADDAVAVAGALDDPANLEHVLRAGIMLGVHDDPGVTWTEPRYELRLAWLHAGELPAFDQIHGHAQPLVPSGPKRPYRVPDDLAGFTHQEDATRHVVSRYEAPEGTRLIVGIDPGANDRHARAPRPRMLSGRLYAAGRHV